MAFGLAIMTARLHPMRINVDCKGMRVGHVYVWELKDLADLR
jgi:hypothetical protein